MGALSPATLAEVPFGAGGALPYDHAIESGARGGLVLERVGSLGPADRARVTGRERTRSERDGHRPADAERAASYVDVARFLDDGDATDRAVAARGRGPLLDVGCGPGRLVRCAILAGRLALGVDVSRAAVAFASDRGLPVLRRSVFDRVPLEGSWSTVLLLDGNIGIGGDPDALLARCADLARRGGEIVVEAHPVHHRDAVFEAVVTDAEGRRSAVFPWAEVGARALVARGARLGLSRAATWTDGGRAFVALGV